MKKSLFVLAILLAGCIGTDELDDPIVGETIVLERDQIAVIVGGSAQAEATFFNRYGIEEDAQLIWSSSKETVATIDITGTITAQSPGQSNLTATVGGTTSPPLLVTVVENEDDVAQVILSSPGGNQISVGQEVSLTVQVLNVLGDPIEGSEILFTALDPDYLQVNQEGVAAGVADGFGRIVASVEGVQSNTLGIQVGQTNRTGTFTGANGYDASGSTELFLSDNGDLMLSLGSNFGTDFALGTYIYLSNSTSGSVTRNEGLEIQEITSGGSHQFNISSIDADVAIDDFDYVVVLCKPATITFGYAELN